MTPEEKKEINRTFVLYCERVKSVHGVTDYRVLKNAGLPKYLLNELRKGKRDRFGLSLSCFIAVFKAFGVEFCLSDYIPFTDPE